MKYMLDTNIFNVLLDGKIDLDKFPKDAEFIATAIQIQEIKNTKNLDRREKLIDKFNEIGTNRIPTTSAVWNITAWGEGCYGEGKLYKNILDTINKKNKHRINNYADALIAETSIINEAILVTADNDLAQVVNHYGGTVDLRSYY